MHIEETLLPGLLVITPKRHYDVRGFFSESYSERSLQDRGVFQKFVQDNHSMSLRMGTVRGLHFQAPPFAQAKLVRCARGALFDVAVDIRKGSPTYGKWFGLELTFENAKQLFIPAGFAHGFVTRSPDTEIFYKCSEYYAPQCEGVIRFDDPTIGIDWGVDSFPEAISEKDAAANYFADFDSPFIYM